MIKTLIYVSNTVKNRCTCKYTCKKIEILVINIIITVFTIPDFSFSQTTRKNKKIYKIY